MSLIKYPYTNLHELNLDWIIEQLNNQDGPVRSVNGKSGIVTLTGEDIVRSSSNPETVATALNTQGTSIQTVRNQIGVTPLPTTAQTLTGAIAENAQEIADLEDNVIGSTELPTEAQTLTGAIAENADNIGGNAESITTINNKIGTTALPTTAQTLTGAIAEHETDITNLNNDKSAKVIASFATVSGNNVFALAPNSRLVLFSADSNANRCGMWIVFSTGGGVTGVVTVATASDVTITEGTGQITFNSQGTPNITFLNMYNNSPASNYVSKQ